MRFSFAIIGVTGILAGCASSTVAPIKKDVEAEDARATKLLKQIQEPVRYQPRPVTAERDSGIWLPARKVVVQDVPAEANPAGKRQVSINRDFRSIQEVAERVTLLTGTHVVVSPDAIPMTTPGAMPGTPGTPGVPGMPGSSPGMPGVPPMLPNGLPNPAAIAGMAGVGSGIFLSFSGPLSDFMDVASARFGVSWEWQGNQIRVFKYTTKTFRLTALPGDLSMQNNITAQTGSSSSSSGSGGSAGGSSTASSTKTTGVSFSGLSVWGAVENSIKTMLSKDGKVTVTPATGTVTVTDTPHIVAQVEKFIDQQNTALGRQVIVNVKVLSVDLNHGNEYGINWDLVHNAVSGVFGLAFGNALAVAPAASSLTMKILSTAAGTNSSLKTWAGSEAMISALASQGNVSLVTSGSVTTLNNQAAPFQVGRQTSYLQSSTTTTTPDVGATTTLQPGLITTGFSMNVMPHVLDKGKLMLQYAINLSSLIDIKTVASGGSSIQTPEIDTRDFLQRVMINSGDTLVMTGFEQTGLDANTQGMISADSPILGGGVKGKRARSVLVIIIQPVIMDV